MKPNECEQCYKEIKAEDQIYEVGDKYVCESCYDDIIGKAELLYDSMKDEGLI